MTISSIRKSDRLGGVALLSVLAALSCQKQETPIQPENDGGVSPAQLTCPTGLVGPLLVRIETAGSVYCMDQREVSWGEYKSFMNAKQADTSGQPAECSWNTSFEPEYYTPDPNSEVDPTHKCPSDLAPTSDDVGADCVDFCDALTYCEWAGKRLCGRIGGPQKWGRMYSGAYAPNEKQALSDLAATPELEFTNACTQTGKTAYAYGNAFEPSRCIDSEWVAEKGKGSLQITDLSTRSCHGTEAPFDQIHDLMGSVEEWQNVCWAAEGGHSCLTQGSSWAAIDVSRQSCAGSIGFGDFKDKNAARGFRCCTDGVLASMPGP